ncbi:uncharacterized protein [Watersipora subatra]|uniref:uncharacterized protein n=1 Tax=Watersipora subatra TaxID=2589382 RepID=UPI00355C87C5
MIEEDAAKSEIHCFSDASTTGYGACAYLRHITKEGEVKCSYLLGKARVAPFKMITIPRMELQAAVVATQLVSVLERALKDFLPANTATHYWCDSMILDPYTDDDGIVRIRERLKYSTTLTIDLKHPAILPKTCNITNLIVQYYHRLTGHSGRGLTTATIRQNGYWITGLSTAVSTVIHNCVICKKLRGNTETQKMADLPAVRLEPATPFHYSGMDCFGPFHAKDGRREVKRYGLMFTCLTSRAVHIEMLDDLTTDAFLNSLRCLIAMRGSVKSLYSDQGTNFRGAQTELKKNLAEINEELHKNLQKMEDLNDPNSHPLTPNHLLHFKSDVCLPPPGDFKDADAYSRKQWRRIQHFANVFWKKWRLGYLQTLQHRQKWTDEKESLKVGDIVFVMDANPLRNQWKLAKVTEMIESHDGRARRSKLTLGNTQLDRQGRAIKQATEIERSLNKLIILTRV